MAGYIEDRWWTKRPDPSTGKKRKTARYGKGMRWRVAGIPGVRDRSFAALEEAKTWRSTALTDSKRQEFIDPRQGSILLRDYVETIWWPARRDPVGTAGPMRSRIWNHLLPHIGHLPMGIIERDHLRVLLATLRDKGLAESTIELVWIHLTSIFKSAVGTRIVKNPCTEMADERPRGGGQTKARAWTREEVRAIRAALPEWYRLCVDIGVMAGLRQGEAFGLSPDDVDEEHGLLHVRRQLQWDPSKPYFKLPKGRKERQVPLSPGLLKAVLLHKEARPSVLTTLPWHGPGNGKRPQAAVALLTTTWFGNPINPTTFNEENWKPALVGAGLLAERDLEAEGSGWEPSRELMFHRCRHTYASVQLHAGEDVVSLSHWMGHSSPQITLDTYAHFMPDQGRRGRSAVDAWLASD